MSLEPLSTLELTLPAHWACALMNGDLSGLTDEEEAQLDAVVGMWEEVEGIAPAPLSCTDEPFFVRGHDATHGGVLACDCLVYTFPLRNL